jgi:GntR family transcriptional regulator / MocR family aminotransferase
MGGLSATECTGIVGRQSADGTQEPDSQMPRTAVQPLWGSLALERTSGLSLQDQILAFFRVAVAEGRMQAGQRLPSSRQLAAECDVSRTTAVEVYQRLVAEGYFITRPGAGVFVADTSPEKFALAATGAAQSAPVMRDAVRRDGRNYMLPLAPGMPAIDQFPRSTWARLTAQVSRGLPLSALGYGDPQGEPALRKMIAGYLATARGILCDPDQVVVTAGTEQTLENMLRQVAAPGDAAWVEEPCGPYLRNALLKAGLRPVPVEVDQEGIDVAQGVRISPGARLAIVQPTHQYPTGATLSMSRREALVQWCENSGAWILESEIDGDYRFAPNPLPPLYTLSRAQRVFYCGSLSKPLAPGLRTNYMVVPRGLMDTFTLSQTLVSLLTQLVLVRFSADGHLASHMRRMRALYARRREVLLDSLREQTAEYLSIPHVPEGGLRVAATLKLDLDDVLLARQCLDAGIKVDPLSLCFAGPGRSGLIIGFASTPEHAIPRAVASLAGVLRRQLDL